MDGILQHLVRVCIVISFMVVLISISVKLSKGNLESIGIYKYTKIIERTCLKKDTDIFVLKIGDEGCVVISSPSKIEKIKDLSCDEIEAIEEKRAQIKNKKVVNLDKDKINMKNINFRKLKLKEKKDGNIN